VSSILEALREIEDERRRARGDQKVSIADAPPVIPGSSGMVYPLIGGLAVGALAFGLWVSGVGREVGRGPAPSDAVLGSEPHAAPPAPAAAPVPHVAAPPPAETGAALAGPAWLDTAEVPQARVAADAPAAGAAPTAPAPAAAPPAGRAAGTIVVESIRFAAAPEQRSVTLRLDGRRVTLHQGERSGGIEVQLIMDDGAYLNRVAEVFFAAPTR
jgi:DNA polymerase-3 subunit gamma/tau